MAFDGIVTYKITQELKNIIGYKVDKIFEPNKNTIILGLYKNGTNISLLSCISSNYYRTHLTTHQFSNPTVAPNFCMLLRKHLIGFKIKNIYTKNLERIIFIDFENLENPNKPLLKRLIIELMGKHSNIILTNENDIIIDSIRHTSTEDHSQRDIYPTSRYILPINNKYNILDIGNSEDFYNIIEPLLANDLLTSIDNSINIDNLTIDTFHLDQIICDNFNGLSKSFVNSIIKDIKLISKDNIMAIYDKILQIINSNNLTCNKLFDKKNSLKDYYLAISNTNDDTNVFEINFFLDDFYFYKESMANFINLKTNLSNTVSNTLKKYNKRLENINSKLLECEHMDKYRIYGELITANLYKIPNKNVENITVENYYDNNSLLTIPLDKRFTPSYNCKQFFKKYSKLKNALEIVNIQKKDTLNDINYIESVLFEIENSSTMDELKSIQDEISDSDIFNIKSQHVKKKDKYKKNNRPLSFNPLKFVFDNYTIYVGRNNKENDYLTTKFANKDDLWFHTKDTHGSHVILKTFPNEVVPDDVILKAAQYAVLHSKAKNSSHVPVDYCLVRFVKKPNNSQPGFVIYKNNKTVFVNRDVDF